MLAVNGMRCLHKTMRLLQQCPGIVIQRFPPCMVKVPNNFYTTSWPSLRPTKQTNNVDGVYDKHSIANSSSESSWPSRDDIELNKRIRSQKTVEELLGLFESVKSSEYIVNRVAMLDRTAKIIERDEKQALVLKEEKKKSQQGQHSAYNELLESLSANISKCHPHGLANVMWALGKLGEKEHKLVEVCEKKILSFDIKVFKNACICQTVNGCTNLSMKKSGLFRKLEEAIINGQLGISTFDNQLLSATLLSFAKTQNGSVTLFHMLMEEILSRNFSVIDSRALASFVWSSAKKGFKEDQLFHQVEEEILRRGTKDLHNAEFIQILWAFSKTKLGSKNFFAFLDTQLVSRGLGRFHNAQLLQIVWAFARSDATEAEVFDVARKEVSMRTVHVFQEYELVLILWSFVSAQRHDEKLVADIESKLNLRGAEKFDIGDLCQIAWCLGRAGKSDSKLFDAIEVEVFRRGTSEFTLNEKLMLMRGFIEAKRGSKEFLERFVDSFSAKELSNLNGGQICECLWCFTKAGVTAAGPFDALETEILRRGSSYFSQKQIVLIRTHFTKLGKERKVLFEL